MKAVLIDIMGSDARVVDSARVSFSKDSSKFTDNQNDKLIKYLAKHNHWTPFSHCIITMREKVPLFVARQRFKHMVGFTYNEVSRRYVDSEPKFYKPDTWRKRAENVKQGSSEESLSGVTLRVVENDYEEALIKIKEVYNELLIQGVCPEQARMVLPQSMYTEYYVTGSLAAWARAYKLRIDSHAQKEIQDLAKQWDELIRPHFPVSWNALTNSYEETKDANDD